MNCYCIFIIYHIYLAFFPYICIRSKVLYNSYNHKAHIILWYIFVRHYCLCIYDKVYLGNTDIISNTAHINQTCIQYNECICVWFNAKCVIHVLYNNWSISELRCYVYVWHSLDAVMFMYDNHSTLLCLYMTLTRRCYVACMTLTRRCYVLFLTLTRRGYVLFMTLTRRC